jgi:hypothetical protein
MVLQMQDASAVSGSIASVSVAVKIPVPPQKSKPSPEQPRPLASIRRLPNGVSLDYQNLTAP